MASVDFGRLRRDHICCLALGTLVEEATRCNDPMINKHALRSHSYLAARDCFADPDSSAPAGNKSHQIRAPDGMRPSALLSAVLVSF